MFSQEGLFSIWIGSKDELKTIMKGLKEYGIKEFDISKKFRNGIRNVSFICTSEIYQNILQELNVSISFISRM